ncbi:hypothetical protein BV898_00604 [Hypsibius exemplaris]|uniref:Chitin-binding type-2 domain-containing protein n=1 Tax=Hypsibius exemplaris TaxID=2072580 RepID=A0A1W0XE78_HYPEX|nr:hypothetical protein BV898_00604 [Hypsibius exemplaris]
MQYLVLFAIIGTATCQFSGRSIDTSKTQGKFVWDLQKAPLTVPEMAVLLSQRDAGYPKHNDIPQTSFSCAAKVGPGFYADPEAQCQVFHRCDQNGDRTSYLCVNSTIFNQITLICDSWFNVDCDKSVDYENYANSRLYTNLPLFDTPPADYVAPSQLVLLQNQALTQQQSAAKPRGRRSF